jgi:hypothetical protein
MRHVAIEDRHDDAESAPDAAAQEPQISAQGAARRRFTKAGIGVSGVILTLVSQPGMATGTTPVYCASASGFQSLTAPGAPKNSHSPANSCTANRSHGYWKNHVSEWKSRCGTDSTALFGYVFSCTGARRELGKYTLLEVLTQPAAEKPYDPNNVAMQIVTALLNARAAKRSGLTSVLPEERVFEIWNEYVNTNGYVPTAGARPWTGAEIANYLVSTFR